MHLSILLRAARVWEKAEKVEGYNPQIWRKDFAGAWIRRQDFGLRTMYGWGIGFICPSSRGGNSEDGNLIPIHWKNKMSKSEDYPTFKSCVTSYGSRNIYSFKEWTITR
mgnify:CR=1 FL=1